MKMIPFPRTHSPCIPGGIQSSNSSELIGIHSPRTSGGNVTGWAIGDPSCRSEPVVVDIIPLTSAYSGGPGPGFESGEANSLPRLHPIDIGGDIVAFALEWWEAAQG